MYVALCCIACGPKIVCALCIVTKCTLMSSDVQMDVLCYPDCWSIVIHVASANLGTGQDLQLQQDLEEICVLPGSLPGLGAIQHESIWINMNHACDKCDKQRISKYIKESQLDAIGKDAPVRVSEERWHSEKIWAQGINEQRKQLWMDSDLRISTSHLKNRGNPKHVTIQSRSMFNCRCMSYVDLHVRNILHMAAHHIQSPVAQDYEWVMWSQTGQSFDQMLVLCEIAKLN